MAERLAARAGAEMIRPLALALVVFAGPASADVDCALESNQFLCDPKPPPRPTSGLTVPYTYNSNQGTLPVQGSFVEPPTPHCEDGWVMVSVASRGTWWVNDQGMTTVKKCVPAGDLKDPK